MNIILIYGVLVCIVICAKDVQCRTLVHTDADKIVGGNDAEIEDYPYQAYLLLYDGRDNYQCGGTIVSETRIVTAAHCLAGIQSIEVRIGSTTSNSGGNTYTTTTFDQHPFYNAATYDYDVAVVTVSDGMDLDGESARAIGVAGYFDDPPEGQNITITGWGATEEGGNVSQTLKEANVNVIARDDCASRIANVNDRQFCAGNLAGGVDTCQGDSGGPAVGDNELKGITSYGIGCARPGLPGVYTRVGNPYVRLFIAMYARV